MSDRTWARLVAVVVGLAIAILAFRPPMPAMALPQPGANVGVATGSGNAYAPSIAIRHDGSVHLVRSEDVTNRDNIWYRQSTTGVPWGTDTRISPSNSDAYNPEIAIELEPVASQGRLYVAYQDGLGSSSDIYFTRSDTGSSWSSPARIDTAGGNTAAQSPDIAASNGHVYIAWSDLRNTPQEDVLLRISGDGGLSWGPEIRLSVLSQANDPPRVAAKGSTVVVAWFRDSLTAIPKLTLARSDNSGASWRWSNVTPPSSTNMGFPSCDLALDELSIAHVAFTWRNGYGPEHVYYSFSGEELDWSSPVMIDDSFVNPLAKNPSISTLAGLVWVVWADMRTGDYDIYSSWSEDGITWGDGMVDGQDLRVDDTDRNAPTTDDATAQTMPTLATGGWGVYAAWEDMRSASTSDIYFSEVVISPLLITEIQDEPLGNARIEVYNLQRASYSLTGVTLMAGASIIDLSPLGSAASRGYFTVGAAPADLVANVSLNPEGDWVKLLRGTDVLSSVGYGRLGTAPDPLSGESTSRYAGTIDYTSLWTRSAATSFHSRNLVPPPNMAPPIVLNEVMFDLLSAGNRFVELCLRKGTTLDITGYRIVSDSVYTMPGGAVGPYPYAVVVEVDAPSLFGSMNPNGDNVYLYDASGRLLDMVGWSRPHNPGTSLARVVAGVGGTRAYDDPTAVANGWAFDLVPSAALIELRSSAIVDADIGTALSFPLKVISHYGSSSYVNIDSAVVNPYWPVTFMWPNGTYLTDSPGDADATIDIGLVNPGSLVSFLAEVSIPAEGTLGFGNTVTARATLASVPTAQSSVSLEIRLRPHFDTYRSADPSQVFAAGSGPPYLEVSNITVMIKGSGYPITSTVPQDVVFQIDVSGSMAYSDSSDLRIDAVQHYIDGMRVDDRASIIGFDDVAWVENNRPLTYTTPAGKLLLRGDADNLRCAVNPCVGGTNIDAAIGTGNNWLITYGNASRQRAEILLTDGVCDPPCTQTSFYVNQAIAAGLTIFTVGLGAYVDEAFLRNVAEPTGGLYYYAETPEDIDAIYQQIALRLNYTVGTDTDVTDDNPMIEDAVAPYLNIVPGSFIDPMTATPKPPEYMERRSDRIVLQWNISAMRINDMWSVQYSVTSSRVGIVDVALHPDARVAYTRWDGVTVQQPIPQAQLEVLAPPTMPFITSTTPTNGTTSVPLNSPILVQFSEDMDSATVNWTITPSMAVNNSWLGPRTLLLYHGGLTECTMYAVQITAGRSTAGLSLVPGPVPNPWGFTTICIEPFIVSTTPADSSRGVPLDADVVVAFSEPMDTATVVWTFSDAGISFSGVWDMTAMSLTLAHSTPFRECTSHSMFIQGRDLNGLDLVSGPVPNPWGFTTRCTEPYIVSTTPVDMAIDVLLDSKIVIVFSERMDVATVVWTFSDPSIAFNDAWDGTNATLTLSPAMPFRECSIHTMFIQGKDMDGLNLIPGPVPNPWSFETICMPPVILSTIPSDHARDVPTTQGIDVAFSESMDTSTVTWTIMPSVNPTPGWSSGDTVLSLVNSPLLLCTKYTVTIDGQDRAGNNLVSGPVPNPWTFETECPVKVTYTITRFPEQGDVLVDDVSYPVPASFIWSPGEVHGIEALEFDPVGGSRLAFNGWSDLGTRAHDVFIGDTDRTITATYELQHPVDLTLIGLVPGKPATISFAFEGMISSDSSVGSWSAWVDDLSTLSVSSLVNGIPGERFVTEDATLWTVNAPLSAVVRYVHQYSANVYLDALEGNSVYVSFTALGIQSSVVASSLFSKWVDAGTDVSTPSELALGPRERFRTIDDTMWRVDAPLDETVRYVHQFRPRVALVGTDTYHTVNALWRDYSEDIQASEVTTEWYDWADAGSLLWFSNRTTGQPPREAQDPTTLAVVAAFDTQIRYSAWEVPPSVSTGQPNWKPLLAVVYAFLLFVAGVSFGSRPLDLFVPLRAGKDPKTWKKRLRPMTIDQKKHVLTVAELMEKRLWDRLLTRVLLAMPFAAAEASIGLMSMQTGLFRIPEAGSWLPVGFWVNTFLLLVGLAIGFVVRLKGYVLTEDDLLAPEIMGEEHGAEPAMPLPEGRTKEGGQPSPAHKVMSRTATGSKWGFNPWARFK